MAAVKASEAARARANAGLARAVIQTFVSVATLKHLLRAIDTVESRITHARGVAAVAAPVTSVPNVLVVCPLWTPVVWRGTFEASKYI